MENLEKKFRPTENVQLIADNTKKYIIEKYHFQLPILQQYFVDNNGRSHPIPNYGHETKFVWCISAETKKKTKIHQDKLELAAIM